MRTIFVFTYVLFVLAGCQSYKMYNSQEINLLNQGSQSFILRGNKIIIPMNIENQEADFMFDTGAATTVIKDTTIIPSYYDKEKTKFGIVKDAQGKTIKNYNFLVSVKNNLVHAPKKEVSYLDVPDLMKAFDCVNNEKLEYQGIFGMDIFQWKNNNLSLFINLSNHELKNLNEKQKQELLDQGFKEIKSKFYFFGSIFIFLEINGKEYKMLFDTGNNGNILLPFSESVNLKDIDYKQYTGFSHISLSGLGNNKKTNYYQNVPIKLNEDEYISPVTLTENLKQQNIGMGFLIGFDWIIDFDKKKIYYKKNNLEFQTAEKKNDASVWARNGQLEIYSVSRNLINEFKPGDIIRKVNNQNITQTNLCEMQKLLNSISDWKSLQIEL